MNTLVLLSTQDQHMITDRTTTHQLEPLFCYGQLADADVHSHFTVWRLSFIAIPTLKVQTIHF